MKQSLAEGLRWGCGSREGESDQLDLGVDEGPRPAYNKGMRLEPETYTAEEIVQMLATQNVACFDGHRLHTLVAFLWRTGVRSSEAVAIRVADLQLLSVRPTVKIVWGKKRNQRTIGLDGDMVLELNSWLDKRCHILEGRGVDGDDPGLKLFPTREGQPMTTKGLRKSVSNLRERAKVGKRIHCHGFRHTFANELVARGLAVADISYLMGHRSIAYTQAYIRSRTAQPGAIAATCSAPTWRTATPRGRPGGRQRGLPPRPSAS